jgi:hypothetical protein
MSLSNSACVKVFVVSKRAHLLLELRISTLGLRFVGGELAGLYHTQRHVLRSRHSFPWHLTEQSNSICVKVFLRVHLLFELRVGALGLRFVGGELAGLYHTQRHTLRLRQISMASH